MEDTTNETTNKTTSVRLEKEHLQWILSQGESFNFSGWVRDRINEVMKGEKVEDTERLDINAGP